MGRRGKYKFIQDSIGESGIGNKEFKVSTYISNIRRRGIGVYYNWSHGNTTHRKVYPWDTINKLQMRLQYMCGSVVSKWKSGYQPPPKTRKWFMELFVEYLLEKQEH